MKKVLLPVIGCVICAAMVAGTGALLLKQDREGPVIERVDVNSDLVYDRDRDVSEFLAAFRAVDEKDGDVSDSLMVETVTQLDDEETVKVVIVAMDSQHNVTKENFEVKYEAANDGAAYDQAADPDEKEDITNEDIDEEKTPEAEQAEVTAAPEITPTLSPEKEAEAAAEEKISLLPAGSPVIRLNEYEVTLPIGTAFNYMDYIKEITDDKDDTNTLYHYIIVDSNVNSGVAGTYTVTYYVNDTEGHQSNVVELQVTVR